jgi:subtilisin family serine protease
MYYLCYGLNFTFLIKYKFEIMKKITRLSTLLALVFVLFGASTLVGQTYDKDYQDGKLYFKFNDNTDISIQVNPDRSVDFTKVALLDKIRAKHEISAMARPFDLNQDKKLLKTFAIEFPEFDQIEEIMDELLQNPDLEYVERVPYHTIDYQPNDPLYSLVNGPNNWNWHLDLINASQAWNISHGSADIKVGIVDNAIWIDHPDLADKIVAQRDTRENDNDPNPPPTFFLPDDDSASWSHGTHVAGLAAGITDNGIGIASIGFNTSIIAVKSGDDNNSHSVYGFPGIEWAANNGADVINMSWGGPSYSTTNQNLINTIYNMGVVMLAAAGNKNEINAHYPSSYNHVISVASVDYNDIKSDFSNYNLAVDVSAPGGSCSPGPSGLLSTYWPTGSLGKYAAISGTSMATPVAAGLASLILGLNAELTPDEVEAIMESTAVDIDELNPDYAGKLGAGRIDAYQAILNTPYAPEAAFSTPVTTIIPGTKIDFSSESMGVPDTYAWSFEGGTPSTSTSRNPQNIEYPTEGTFNVSLTVTNAYGDDDVTINNYITVTNTPKPWVDFAANKTEACVFNAVEFTDMSLYDPISWNWEFSPNNVSFIDGTSAASQNPVVEFTAPGSYEVTLVATNANGSNTLAKADFIHAQGIIIPFEEDFETGESAAFSFEKNEKGNISIDARAAAPGSSYGLHFQGNTYIGGWVGDPAATTPEQAWVTNEKFHSTASACNVDATGVTALALTLDLKQTYGIGISTSWFRVLANEEQISDILGTENFNPTTNSDPFETKMFDLSMFGNTNFSLKLQASCYLSDQYIQEGDNVFVDNVSIYNFTDTKETLSNASALMYPVPAYDQVNISLAGFDGNYAIKIFNVQGQKVFEQIENVFVKNTVKSIDISNLIDGVYFLKVISAKNEITKKLIIR